MTMDTQRLQDTSLSRLILGILVLWLFLVDHPVCSVEPGRPRPTPSEDSLPSQGPVFIAEPPSLVVYPNTLGVMVPCTAYGRPAPALDWFNETIAGKGQVVDDLAGVVRVLANNTLHILPFTEQDFLPQVHSGMYRCNATNEAGTIVSRAIQLKAVLIEPYKTYNIRVNEIYVTRGNTAVFRCNVNPYYIRDYINVTSWSQSGKTITAGERFSILPNGELHIRSVRTDDSYAPYRCTTQNVLTGEQKYSDPATLYVIDPVNSSPSIEASMPRISVQQGDSVELPCVASAFPLPSYTWTRDGVTIATDQQRVRQHGGNLALGPVVVSDSGTYHCTAKNALGEKTVTTTLVVTAMLSAYIEPPKQTIDVGQLAMFNCSVYGHPVTSIKWYKDGLPLATSARVTIVTDSVLRIVSVEREDRGMYQCMVGNDQENAQGAAQLLIGAAKPYMFETFEDQYTNPGPRVSLKCSASGNPIPHIRWTLDDGPIPLDDRFMVSMEMLPDGDVISYLNVTNVKVEDGGLYRCTAENSVGSATHVGKINVYGVPRIRPMSNVTAISQEVLVIQCYVSGYPIHSISWSRGGKTLPINHRQEVSPDGRLTIQHVERILDAGEYTCDARNAQEQGMRRSVFVQVMEPPRVDSFSFPARKQGDRVSVYCAVNSGDLPLHITWLKNGHAIPSDLGIYTQKMSLYSSLLSIGEVSPHHNGNYTCIASNSFASANHTAYLHVDVPPRWVVEPSDSSVRLGDMVVIHCQTVGDPQPKVTWKKALGNSPGNYQDLEVDEDGGSEGQSSSGQVSHLVQLSNGSLVVNSAQAKDAGYYLCHATNNIGAGLSRVVFLTVHIPAKFHIRERNYTVHHGDNITMECVADGDTPLSLAWSFNGGMLNLQNRGRVQVPSYYFTPTGKGSKLEIKSAESQDTGYYVCNAKNMFGSDAMTIRLLVLEPPHAPEGVMTLEGDSRKVKVKWIAPFNGNSPLLGFYIQYKLASDTWDTGSRNVSVGSEVRTALVADLHPAYSYHIRLLAYNAIGVSTPSVVVQYSTGEEVPTGPPRNVTVLGAGSTSLKVMWQSPAPEQENGQITGYYIGYKPYNTTNPYMYVTRDALLEADPGHVYEYLIQNLAKFTMYAVHVQAYNVKGAGPRSQDIGVLTLEDVPSQPPEDVQGSALSSQSLLVVWSPPPLYTLHGILQGYRVVYRPVVYDEDESDEQWVVTSKLTAALYGLEKYTNYSIQVLAYTRMGQGVRSLPIYVITHQDVPESPADIKAVSAGPRSILVSWRPPLHANGILIKYTLSVTPISYTEDETVILQLPPEQQSHLVTNLSTNHQYGFRVSASTMVGDGEATREVDASTQNTVSARIGSFSGIMHSHWHMDVILPCLAVGIPQPSVKWTKRGEMLPPSDRVVQHENGSLVIHDTQTSDAANYSCRAENEHGADEITVSLIVQAPPKAPVLSVALTTASTIQVNWRSGSNGGSKIQGFILQYKRETDTSWNDVKLSAHDRTYIAEDLRCGSRYEFKVYAYNQVGDGLHSNMVTTQTNGSAPIMPAQSLILTHINSTFIDLDLSAWQDGGCPVLWFDMAYQFWGNSPQWQTVERQIAPDAIFYRVDLRPETWYLMKVTANNDAGSTDCVLKFSTKSYSGSTVEPLRVVHRYQVPFYQRLYIMVPLCTIIVFVTVLIVALALYCRRRQQDFKYKAENASNLRKDLTAETSLMSDIDKQALQSEQYKPDPGTSIYSPEPRADPHNINLLTASAGELGEVPVGREAEQRHTWSVHNSSGGGSVGRNSSGSSHNTVDEEGNIYAYATFPRRNNENATSENTEVKQVNRDPERQSHDSLYDQKQLAQKMALEGLYSAEGSLAGLSDLPPPPPDMLSSSTPSSYNSVPAKVEKGVLLSPHLYTNRNNHTFGTHPFAAYLTTHNKHNPPPVPPRTISDKAGQRFSTVSTVSSNHDELVQALNNLPDPTSPSVNYDPSPDSDRQSQGSRPDTVQRSDSITASLRDFTQSPARPNESRYATCEVPVYDRSTASSSQSQTLSSFRAPPTPFPQQQTKPRLKDIPLLQQISKKLNPYKSRESLTPASSSESRSQSPHTYSISTTSKPSPVPGPRLTSDLAQKEECSPLVSGHIVRQTHQHDDESTVGLLSTKSDQMRGDPEKDKDENDDYTDDFTVV